MRTQRQFTQYIRDPKNSPKPTDIEGRRMDIYRDLLFTNISNVLSDAFPVLKTISDHEYWEELCRNFFTHHQSHSPYFSEISQEFIQFLQTERLQNPLAEKDFPFLLELAHYEWTELYVSIAEEDETNSNISKELDNEILTVSSTALSLAYTYPVHKISADFLPTEPAEQPTYLVVYRSADNCASFLETTDTTHALLTALSDNTELTTRDLLSKLAQDLQHPNPQVVIDGGLTILEDFILRSIVVITSH
ncbi:MAG: DUF2063 domain-containing protein [Cycloclasticus sp. symbiont of Poecilosclerida sp. N]|nr:MAG: DUF2063 domain-containing protein [Cycloclasticus sp. symbiont of Poecilosclerida sp. N]